MGLLEILLIVVLSYGSGYYHSYKNRPIIKFDFPKKLIDKSYKLPACKQGTDPATGLYIECIYGDPHWEVSLKNMSKDTALMIARRQALEKCDIILNRLK